jgi:hypothetical protein
MRSSTLIMIAVAAVFGLLAVFVSQAWLNRQAEARLKSLEAQKTEPIATRTLVVASRPLRFGTELTPSVLRELSWAGDDVPVLGALFASRAYQKNETDLIIIVTPRIVRPTRPGDVIATPLDNTLPANDIDFFLFGKGEVARRENRRGEATYGHRPIGHMLDLPKGDQHASLR